MRDKYVFNSDGYVFEKIIQSLKFKICEMSDTHVLI